MLEKAHRFTIVNKHMNVHVSNLYMGHSKTNAFYLYPGKQQQIQKEQ